jgi:hypothetical protein
MPAAGGFRQWFSLFDTRNRWFAAYLGNLPATTLPKAAHEKVAAHCQVAAAAEDCAPARIREGTMRCLCAGLIALLLLSPAMAAPRPPDITSADAALRWISAYRGKPDPGNVPAVMRALSRFGACNEPDRCGVYVGFLAGVLESNPDMTEQLISQTLTVRIEDRWIVVRAIAYSGLPNWKELLPPLADRVPERRVMIEKYLTGKLPTLDQLVIAPSPSSFERLREHFQLEGVFGKSKRKVMMEPSPEVLDILWGYYFATGSYGPVISLTAMLAWSDDQDDVERLTIGSMAKYTLANNATRDQALLAMLKSSSKARNQPKKTVAALNEITEAAETVDTARIRKQAIAAVDELRRKGPAYKRTVSWWGYVGQSTIAAGCIAAAVTAQVAFGLPCVVGGATASAATNFWANQP